MTKKPLFPECRLALFQSVESGEDETTGGGSGEDFGLNADDG